MKYLIPLALLACSEYNLNAKYNPLPGGGEDEASGEGNALEIFVDELDEEEIEGVVWSNPINFFAQSGRISEEDFLDNQSYDRTNLHAGNSVLRGQKP